MAAIFFFLSPAVEVGNPSNFGSTSTEIAQSKRIVAKLTALFSLDAFGGGFLTDALVAYWFFRHFGMLRSGSASLFFACIFSMLRHTLEQHGWLATLDLSGR